MLEVLTASGGRKYPTIEIQHIIILFLKFSIEIAIYPKVFINFISFKSLINSLYLGLHIVDMKTKENIRIVCKIILF